VWLGKMTFESMFKNILRQLDSRNDSDGLRDMKNFCETIL